MNGVRFAFECYADGDVLAFLKQTCGLPLASLHAFGQGEVINEVLVRRRARIGMIDEDPGQVPSRALASMQVVERGPDIEWRRQGDRHLIVVKPELEPCLLRTFTRVRLDSALPRRADELHRLLTVPNRRKHDLLRSELATAHERAKARGLATFTAELERVVRAILAE